MPSRARLWTYDTDAAGWDYVTLNVLTPNIVDNEPVVKDQGRLGRSVLITPPDASEAASWADTLELAIHRRYCFHQNTPPVAGTDRLFNEWLKHYYRDLKQEFYVYLETYGADSSGAAVHTITYYKGYLHGQLPSWFIDGQFAVGRGSDYVKLTLVVGQTNAEGSVASFDATPLAGGNLTPRSIA